MKINLSIPGLTSVLALTLLIAGCGKDEPATLNSEGSGEFRLEITDAPVDDANVQAVFVTVADVRVGGTALEGFSRSTVELSALTNGQTELLFSGNLDAGAYSSLELVLEDGENTVNGGPGCYLLTRDNVKVALEVANDGLIRIEDSAFELSQIGSVEAVIDFDLRKALERKDDEQKPYGFAAESRLRKSLRLVEKSRSGTLRGSVTNNTSENGQVVVYAYTKGSYSAGEAEGDDDALFLNAVTSSKLNANGEYTLSFLNEGSYELVAVAYEDTDRDGEIEFKGEFSLTAVSNLSLNGLDVSASSTTTADFMLTALLP